MKALVTPKGRVTIPKELRNQFGTEPGAQVDFGTTTDGIRPRICVAFRHLSFAQNESANH